MQFANLLSNVEQGDRLVAEIFERKVFEFNILLHKNEFSFELY